MSSHIAPPTPCRQRRRKRLRQSWVKRRPLLVPFNNDRTQVGQFAAELKWAIEPMLAPTCHGYRPRRSVQTAIAHVATLTGPITAFDITNFFPSIDHTRLRRHVNRIDPDWWDRLWPWLPERGLAMGVAFSPVLSNVYLHEIDRRFPQAVRYVDNIIIAGDPTPLVNQLTDIDLSVHAVEPNPSRWLGQPLTTATAAEVSAS